MRLISYRSEGGARAGALLGRDVVDLAEALDRPRGRAGMRELLADHDLVTLAGAVADRDPVARLEEVELLPPVPDPQKIVCIGLNYRDHAAEAGLEPPEVPTFFAKFANALAADGATVTLPAASSKVDFEAEIAFVVGRRCREIPAERALEHIAGFTLLNDLSARDLQFATPQWIPGKVFDGSAPCGPAIVTADEAGPHDRIEIALDLNGERMQQARSDDMVFSIPELLAHLSTLMTLEPGDVVSTGTPAGVGSTRQPRIWLGDGDELVVTSSQLGELRTRIAR